MKHEVGEVVQIMSLDWYDKNKDNFGIISKHYGNFTPSMSAFCGRITEIKNISDEYGFKAGYYIKLDDKNSIWQDWMFEPAKIYGGFGVTRPQENEEVGSDITSFEGITSEMLETYTKKNADYGGSFDKSMNEFGLVSAVIRMSDKIERLKSLVKQDAKVKEESIEDTLHDLASYAVMTLINLKKNNYG